MPESSLLHILHTKIKDQTMTLPTLPDVAVKVMAISDRPEVNSNELCQAISRDSGISMRLIRLANSAHFKRKVDVTTIQQAVVRLGFRQVRSLVIAMAMEQLFISTDQVVHNKLQDMWLDSVRITCAALAYDSIVHKGKYSDVLMLLGMTSRLGMLSILTEVEKTFSGGSILKTLDYDNLAIIERSVLLTIFSAWEFPKEHTDVFINYFNKVCSNPITTALLFGNLFGGKKAEEYKTLLTQDQNIQVNFPEVGADTYIELESVYSELEKILR
jgi:HD-like signal output (HDOD) protein